MNPGPVGADLPSSRESTTPNGDLRPRTGPVAGLSVGILTDLKLFESNKKISLHMRNYLPLSSGLLCLQ